MARLLRVLPRHPLLETPCFDALAADGVLFTNHFAQCSPSGTGRTFLLTGTCMKNHRSVRNGIPLDERFTNLAVETRKVGYKPGLIGDTDISYDPRQYLPRDPALTRCDGVMPGFARLVPGSEVGSRGMARWPTYRAEDSDTAYTRCSATGASCRPSGTAATTAKSRIRRSTESAFDISTGLLPGR